MVVHSGKNLAPGLADTNKSHEATAEQVSPLNWHHCIELTGSFFLSFNADVSSLSLSLSLSFSVSIEIQAVEDSQWHLSLAHTQTAKPNKGTSVSMASQNHQWVPHLCTIQFSFSVKSSNCEYQECHKMKSPFCLGYLQLHSWSRFAVIILCLVFRKQSRPFTLITYCSLEQSHFSLRFLSCHIDWCHKIDNKASTLNNNKLINVLLFRLRQICKIVCYNRAAWAASYLMGQPGHAEHHSKYHFH